MKNLIKTYFLNHKFPNSYNVSYLILTFIVVSVIMQ